MMLMVFLPQKHFDIVLVLIHLDLNLMIGDVDLRVLQVVDFLSPKINELDTRFREGIPNEGRQQIMSNAKRKKKRTNPF
jgi:hypothetical protein